MIKEDIKNDMNGTMFSIRSYGESDQPIKVGVVNIDGVRVNIAVYPEELSRRGRYYNPIRLSYPHDEPNRLSRISDF